MQGASGNGKASALMVTLAEGLMQGRNYDNLVKYLKYLEIELKEWFPRLNWEKH